MEKNDEIEITKKHIIILCISFIVLILLISCGVYVYIQKFRNIQENIALNKESIIIETFIEKMEDKTHDDFNVVDCYEGLEDKEDISVAYTATGLDTNIHIEYYEVTENKAIEKYENDKDYFADLAGGVIYEYNFEHVSYFEVTSDEDYFVTSKIGNTYVLAMCILEHKDTLQEILGILGYERV